MARNSRPYASVSAGPARALLLSCLLAWPLQAPAGNPWATVSLPSGGAPRVIGGAGGGCIGGAETLPETGPGYVSVRRGRNRYYGHPDTLRLVADLGSAFAQRREGLVMIGDLSQPRGGQMASSHRSHQNGLDLDIWFTLAPSAEAARRLMDNQPDPRSMVEPGGQAVSAAWGEPQRALLETAARHPLVDRIFVNAALKRSACAAARGDRGWLRKVRPWWGHDAHFHVRLRCPPGSPECEPQKALPAGDGCGSELDWWFSPEVTRPAPKKAKPAPAEPRVPAACMAVLSGS